MVLLPADNNWIFVLGPFLLRWLQGHRSCLSGLPNGKDHNPRQLLLISNSPYIYDINLLGLWILSSKLLNIIHHNNIIHRPSSIIQSSIKSQAEIGFLTHCRIYPSTPPSEDGSHASCTPLRRGSASFLLSLRRRLRIGSEGC